MSSGRVIPGRLLETHVARVLFSAQRKLQTGLLTVDEGPVQTKLHIVDGRVVFAEAGTVAETLGRILLKAGTIDRDEYLVILEHMSKPSDRDAVLRFGEVAISLGMLEPAQLSDALALQVRTKLARCLLVDEAVWIWVDDEAPRRTMPYPTPLEPTLLDALRTDRHAPRWLGLLAAKRHCAAAVSRSADEIARRFVLGAPELRFLSLLDGRPLQSILDDSPLEPEETAAVIVTLFLADVLDLTPPRAPRRRVESAPRVPIVTNVPEPAPEHRARDAAERLREEMMRRRGPHPQPASQRARVDAERAFERGKRMLAQGAVERACVLLEEASQLMPEAADYALYAYWARYIAASDPLLKTVHAQQLRDAVLAALQQDRRMSFAHYVQGRLYLADGDERAAERAFGIAARLDPSDVDAARYVRLLRSRRE